MIEKRKDVMNEKANMEGTATKVFKKSCGTACIVLYYAPVTMKTLMASEDFI